MPTKTLSPAIVGAPIRTRRKNNQEWLYFGHIKIGRILPGGILEVKDAHWEGRCERVPLREAGRQLVVISRRVK